MKLLLSLILLIFSQHVTAQPQNSLPECTLQFVADYSAVTNALTSVVSAIDSKSSAQAYRASLVTGLNACHCLVEKHVQIDPVSGEWMGQACLRKLEIVGEILDPKFHKAECEYLQRLLDREDSSL